MRRYESVQTWVAGAVGRPGERTFMIQFTADDGVHAYVLEKGQVAALVIEAQRLLASIQSSSVVGDVRRPDDAVVPEFRIAEIQLIYEEASSVMKVRLTPATDDMDGVEFAVPLEEFAAALPAAAAAVEGGRPACPRCGLAIDPDGHHCPSTNGDLRGHRP